MSSVVKFKTTPNTLVPRCLELFESFCLRRDTKQCRHSHNVVESKHCTVSGVKDISENFASNIEILVSH